MLVTTAQVVLMLRHKIWHNRATMWPLQVKADKLHALLEHTIHSTPKPYAYPALMAITVQFRALEMEVLERLCQSFVQLVPIAPKIQELLRVYQNVL